MRSAATCEEREVRSEERSAQRSAGIARTECLPEKTPVFFRRLSALLGPPQHPREVCPGVVTLLVAGLNRKRGRRRLGLRRWTGQRRRLSLEMRLNVGVL